MTGKQLSHELKADRAQHIIDLVDRLGVKFPEIGERLGMATEQVRALYAKAKRIRNDSL